MWGVQQVKFSGGERVPVLCRVDGVPEYDAMAWLLSMRRSKNLAYNTLLADARALAVLYNWAKARSIDVRSRFLQGEFLRPFEMMNLAGRTKYWSGSELSVDDAVRDSASTLHVCTNHQINRLNIISLYFEWLVWVCSASSSHYARSEFSDRGQRFVQKFREVFPKAIAKSALGGKQALSEDYRIQLLDGFASGLYDLWKPVTKPRNILIFEILFGLGIRPGELLKIKISDIDFRCSEIMITRSPDDPDDPRINPPQAKTSDRILPLSNSLMSSIEAYVFRDRQKLPNAKKNPFLIVGSSSGEPLSHSMLDKIFRGTRQRLQFLPIDFTPHSARHTYATRLAESFERNNVGIGDQELLWSAMMGWKLGSGTEATYTRRRIIEKANQFSLELQNDLFKGLSISHLRRT